MENIKLNREERIILYNIVFHYQPTTVVEKMISNNLEEKIRFSPIEIEKSKDKILKFEKSELDLLSKEFLKMEEFDDISYDLGLKLKLWN